MIEQGTEGIDVARRPDGTKRWIGLLRWHEVRRAENLAGRREFTVVREAFGKAEVRDVWFARRVDEDVGRFQITMNDALLMRVVDGRRNFPEMTRRRSRGQGTAARDIRETLSFDEIHREVVLAFVFTDVVDGDDVRVAQAGRSFGLGAEAFHKRVAGEAPKEQHLHGNDAVQRDLPGAINDAHTPARDFVEQFVVSERPQAWRNLGDGDGFG